MTSVWTWHSPIKSEKWLAGGGEEMTHQKYQCIDGRGNISRISLSSYKSSPQPELVNTLQYFLLIYMWSPSAQSPRGLTLNAEMKAYTHLCESRQNWGYLSLASIYYSKELKYQTCLRVHGIFRQNTGNFKELVTLSSGCIFLNSFKSLACGLIVPYIYIYMPPSSLISLPFFSYQSLSPIHAFLFCFLSGLP